MRGLVVICAAVFFVAKCLGGEGGTGSAQTGLIATITQGEKRDRMVVPNFAFYLGKGEAPSVFTAPGECTVEFAGGISVELRGQYTFRALVKGKLELEINGSPILQVVGNGELSEPSKTVRLNKGTNSVFARFTTMGSGEGELQVFWASKNFPQPIPIPTEALTFNGSDAELVAAQKMRIGVGLFLEYRCVKCHRTELSGAAELEMDAPDFLSIGNRLDAGWIEKWIQDPEHSRMPKLFSEDTVAQNASDIATYLETIQGKAVDQRIDAKEEERGKTLFHDLHCEACHSKNEDGSLANVGYKFRPGALAVYLQNPQAHYQWNPMPNFRLSGDEASALENYLRRQSKSTDQTRRKAVAPEKGRGLVQQSGCLNCHGSEVQNRYSAPDLDQIRRSPADGCLSSNSGRAPRFSFQPGEREALQEFLKRGDFLALTRDVPHEFAIRQSERLRCQECHEKVEGLPRLSAMGGKLKPEAAERYIAGSDSHKPRPWITVRMPGFPAYAKGLSRGFAALHGNPPRTPPPPSIDLEKGAVGAKLISAAGGFSCVACHAVGNFSGGQVVESPGINLAYSGERLLKSYFDRWVMNPVQIEPSTKMPVYFDSEGRSQLTEFFEGDGRKQIDAIWEYVLLGEKMPAPPSP